MPALHDREGGFIIIHRQVRSSRLYRSLSAEQKAVFLTILLLANWAEDAVLVGGTWQKIRRGELAHSLSTIAEEAGTSIKVVRTTIAKLQIDDRPAGGRGPFLVERWTGTEKGTGLRVLTVVNYDEYQRVGREAGTPPGTAAGTGGAQQGHASGTAGAPREPEEPDQPEEEALRAAPAAAASAAPPPVAGEEKKPKRASTSAVALVEELEARRKAEIPDALPSTLLKASGEPDFPRIQKLLAADTEVGKALRERGSRAFVAAFEFFLADPFWRAEGAQVAAFLAQTQWPKFLARVQAAPDRARPGDVPRATLPPSGAKPFVAPADPWALFDPRKPNERQILEAAATSGDAGAKARLAAAAPPPRPAAAGGAP